MSYQARRAILCCTVALAAIFPATTFCLEENSSTAQDLSSLSLEDLTHIDVSSVSRKSQELFKTPAAVFVITREDIKASGVNSLPEIFRMVPGMQVAQVSANTWAISARGFNGRFSDKMLVLIDGRSVYSEIYSGVFWDMNDVSMEDIERIEVIRGPGGTLWGANAVNGVINIITRAAKQTLGTKTVAIEGRMEQGGSIRHGATLGQNFQYRGYVKYLRHNSLLADDGSSSEDAGDTISVGGRGDLQASAKDLLSFHANFMRGSAMQRIIAASTGAAPVVALDQVSPLGGYLLARWEHRFAGSDFALQSSYSDEYRMELAGTGREHILDFDFQHHLPTFHRNDVVWGLGFRVTTDHIFHTPAAFVNDDHRDVLSSLFFQDDYAVVPDKLVLTGGFKLQHNSYTGFEIQPGGRIMWTPDTHHAAWAAVSRAVRTPSVQDRDLHFLQPLAPQNGLPAQALALGNPNFQSEVALAYEAGYRQSMGDKVSLDVAAFVNRYSKLNNQEFLAPYLIYSPTPTIIVPILYGNDATAKSHGVEAAASWNASHALNLQASYTWMNGRLRLPPGTPTGFGSDTWSSPNNTVDVRSTWNFAHHWTLNSSVYFASRLERVSPNGIPPARAFVRLDQHVSFNFFESLKLTAGVDNLLQSRHPEFDPTDGYTVRSQVPRSAFLKAVWSF